MIIKFCINLMQDKKSYNKMKASNIYNKLDTLKSTFMIRAVILTSEVHQWVNGEILGFLFCRICKSVGAVTMRRVSDALKLSGCALTKSI